MNNERNSDNNSLNEQHHGCLYKTITITVLRSKIMGLDWCCVGAWVSRILIVVLILVTKPN
jgi:hypothetical protein